MDLDVLLYGDQVEKTAEYTLPRPDLLKRPYMLGPMAEIAPDVVHPTAGRTIGAVVAGVRSRRHRDERRVIAAHASPAASRSQTVRRVAETVPGPFHQATLRPRPPRAPGP